MTRLLHVGEVCEDHQEVDHQNIAHEVKPGARLKRPTARDWCLSGAPS